MKSLIAIAALITLAATDAQAFGRRHRNHCQTTQVCQPCQQAAPVSYPSPPVGTPVSLTEPQTQAIQALQTTFIQGGCANGNCAAPSTSRRR